MSRTKIELEFRVVEGNKILNSDTRCLFAVTPKTKCWLCRRCQTLMVAPLIVIVRELPGLPELPGGIRLILVL